MVLPGPVVEPLTLALSKLVDKPGLVSNQSHRSIAVIGDMSANEPAIREANHAYEGRLCINMRPMRKAKCQSQLHITW